jgi:hypothetical protein
VPVTLRLHSEPYSPSGNMAATGVRKLLGAPRLDLLQTVVREAVQNCCDAAKNGVGPRVIFRLRRLTAAQLWILGSCVLAELPRHADTADPIRQFLRSDNPWVLEICDFATTGLEGPTRADLSVADGERTDFINFVRDIGTARDTVLGGGTYGFGKSALYLASNCSLILVDTETRCGGLPVRRILGAQLGDAHVATVEGIDRRFTGRHWWGVTEGREGFADPLEGEDAATLSNELGLPERARGETGTSIMIVDPQFVDENIRDVVGAIQEALLWNFWPRMMADVPAERRLDVSVELDGEDQQMPAPESTPPLDLFCDAMSGIRNGAASVRKVECQRPAAELGQLNIVKGFRGERVPLRLDGESLFPATNRHIAVMRPVELVVRYFDDGDPLPQQEFEWAGVFITSADPEIEKAFADAEPPAHDDWQPDILPMKSWARRYVRVALSRIRDAAHAVAGGKAEERGGQVAAPSLGQVADLFGRALGSANRQGAGPRSGGSGPGGGGRRASAISRPIFEKLDEASGEAFALFRSDVRNDDGSALVLELQPTVVVDGGGTAAEGGSDEPPRIVAVWSDEGMVTERDGRYELGEYAGRLHIAVGLPRDGAVTLKASVAVGEAA